MIFQFSLYGFLKNQRYFEPFFILFLLEKGLSFTQIGILVGFREISVGILEIPTGAVADLSGRRRSMVFSFLAYIFSFLLFTFSSSYAGFFPAMALFATGESFRTGTHKAMIFTWLRRNNRISERSRVYGYTRSWSKIGSAVSIPISALLVMFFNGYAVLFLFTLIPYTAALINFLFYPRELEGEGSGRSMPGLLIRHLAAVLKKSLQRPRLRRLLIESMGFEGVFKAALDYLQPVLQQLALALPFLICMEASRRNAVVVGIVYVLLYLGAAAASRNAYRFNRWSGGEENAARSLWRLAAFFYVALIPLLLFKWYPVSVVFFMGLFLVQNIWRPLLISRFDAYASETEGATVLSIESQGKSLATMLTAPLMGIAVDVLKGVRSIGPFWPVALIGALVSLTMLYGLKERMQA